MLYVAIGIIGATVMPHNLYLHSALVQSRKLQKDEASIRRAIRFNTIDSTVALSIAFFRQRRHPGAGGDGVLRQRRASPCPAGRSCTSDADSDWIRVAYLTLAPLLGTAAASMLFAVALLASGQSSTITGTLAGQVVMEGFMHWRISPWVRRLITRAAGDPAGGARHRRPRRRQRHRSAHAEPGGAGAAAAVRDVSAAAFHQLAKADGAMEERAGSC